MIERNAVCLPTTFTAQSEEGSLSVDHAHLDGLESKELIGYLEGYMEETRASMASIKSTRQAGTSTVTGHTCQWPWCPYRKKEEEEERSVGCECYRRTREELELTHKMLNENGARQYGTLLRENISLQEQVCVCVCVCVLVSCGTRVYGSGRGKVFWQCFFLPTPWG